jgi:hypothetical protein
VPVAAYNDVDAFNSEFQIDCSNVCSAVSIGEPLLDQRHLLSVEDELSMGAAPPW